MNSMGIVGTLKEYTKSKKIIDFNVWKKIFIYIKPKYI